MNRIIGIFMLLASLLIESTPISVQNPNFIGTAGWKFGPSSGVIEVNGKSVAYAGYGGSFSQDLGVSPRTIQKPSSGWQYGTEGVYTLTFSVANYFPSYPGEYHAELSYGTQELCETYGWPTGKFNQITLACPSPNYMVLGKSLPNGGPQQGANDLILTFIVNDGSANGGWPVLFDNISLTFTPEASQ